MELIFTLDTIHDAATRLLQASPDKKVYAIHGEMGAGKTTFVYALCRLLEVVDDVSSPTFPIINEYETRTGETVYHIDLYRLAGVDEARQAGAQEAIDSGFRCFVEWPERAPSLFSSDAVHLSFSVVNETTRRLTIVD